jgi:hypothetical protein
MTDVSVRVDFDRPAAVLWATIGDFCGIDRWLPGIQRVESEDEGKRRRIILPNGGVVLEQEVARDEASMSLTYTVIAAPMPFTNYRSTMCVESRGERCSVCWSATFTPIGPEDKVARLVGSLYNAGLKGLHSLVVRTAGEPL